MEEQHHTEHYPVYNLFTARGWLWVAIFAVIAALATGLKTNSYNRILRGECGAGIIALELAGYAASANTLVEK